MTYTIDFTKEELEAVRSALLRCTCPTAKDFDLLARDSDIRRAYDKLNEIHKRIEQYSIIVVSGR
jgi:hypothetical protein